MTNYAHINQYGSITDALEALDGSGVLEFGAGLYDLGEGLCIDGQIELVGAGRNATTLSYGGAGAAIQINSGRGIVTKRWGLRDLALIGAGGVGLRLGQGATRPQSANTGVVERLHISGFAVGAHCQFSQINTFRDVTFESNATGLLMVPDLPGINGNTSTTLLGCLFLRNSGVGAELRDAAHIAFVDCLFEGNGLEGAKLNKLDNSTGRRSVRFNRCYFEGNNNGRSETGHAQLWIDSEVMAGWQDVSVSWCFFSGAGANNAHIRIGKALAEVVYANVADGQPLGITGNNATEQTVVIESHAQPSWVGDGLLPVLWRQAGGDGQYRMMRLVNGALESTVAIY